MPYWNNCLYEFTFFVSRILSYILFHALQQHCKLSIVAGRYEVDNLGLEVLVGLDGILYGAFTLKYPASFCFELKDKKEFCLPYRCISEILNLLY